MFVVATPPDRTPAEEQAAASVAVEEAEEAAPLPVDEPAEPVSAPSAVAGRDATEPVSAPSTVVDMEARLADTVNRCAAAESKLSSLQTPAELAQAERELQELRDRLREAEEEELERIRARQPPQRRNTSRIAQLPILSLDVEQPPFLQLLATPRLRDVTVLETTPRGGATQPPSAHRSTTRLPPSASASPRASIPPRRTALATLPRCGAAAAGGEPASSPKRRIMLDVDETLVTELEAFARDFGAVEGAPPPNGEGEEEQEAGKENAGSTAAAPNGQVTALPAGRPSKLLKPSPTPAARATAATTFAIPPPPSADAVGAAAHSPPPPSATHLTRSGAPKSERGAPSTLPCCVGLLVASVALFLGLASLLHALPPPPPPPPLFPPPHPPPPSPSPLPPGMPPGFKPRPPPAPPATPPSPSPPPLPSPLPPPLPPPPPALPRHVIVRYSLGVLWPLLGLLLGCLGVCVCGHLAVAADERRGGCAGRTAVGGEHVPFTPMANDDDDDSASPPGMWTAGLRRMGLGSPPSRASSTSSSTPSAHRRAAHAAAMWRMGLYQTDADADADATAGASPHATATPAAATPGAALLTAARPFVYRAHGHATAVHTPHSSGSSGGGGGGGALGSGGGALGSGAASRAPSSGKPAPPPPAAPTAPLSRCGGVTFASPAEPGAAAAARTGSEAADGYEAYGRRGSLGSYQSADGDPDGGTDGSASSPLPRFGRVEEALSPHSVGVAETPDCYRVRWEGAHSPDRA